MRNADRSVFEMSDDEFLTTLKETSSAGRSALTGKSFCTWSGRRVQGKVGPLATCPGCGLIRTPERRRSVYVYAQHFPRSAARLRSHLEGRRFCSYSGTAIDGRRTRPFACPTCGAIRKPSKGKYALHFAPVEAGYRDRSDHSIELNNGQTPSAKGRYGLATLFEFPLLTHFGMWSVDPAWCLDRSTGEVRPAGEFEALPSYFLNVRNRPAAEDLKALGGYQSAGTRFDVMVDTFKDLFPWLQLETGEQLRQELLQEIDGYERTHNL